MDSALAVAAAIAIAGTVASLVQERFLDKWQGDKARLASIGLALAIGIVAVIKTGGFVAIDVPAMPSVFDVGISILANATLVLVASQAAFRVLVRPVTQP